MAHPDYRYEHINMNGQHSHFELSIKDSSFVTMHWHDALEIIRVLSGHLEVVIDQQHFYLTDGDVIIIRPDELHSTISTAGNTSILLQIPSADLYHYVPDMREMQIIWNPRNHDFEVRTKMERVRSLIDLLLDADRNGGNGKVLLFESRLLELIYRLYTDFTRETTRADLHRSEKDLQRLAEIIQFTQCHYTESISLKDVADELHLQPNYFCRFFKTCTGQTYLEYLCDFRLSKIYDELISTNLTIAALMEKNGFTNGKLFRQSFLERFGETPSSLRNHMK